jgi:hypothetical protein
MVDHNKDNQIENIITCIKTKKDQSDYNPSLRSLKNKQNKWLSDDNESVYMPGVLEKAKRKSKNLDNFDFSLLN